MALSALPLSASVFATRAQSSAAFSRLLSHPLIPSLSLSIPSAIQFNLPPSFSELWDSLLRAVPKKKTSYSKKRSRQMAGKALKDVTALNRCPACGGLKKAHQLCPSCVKRIQNMWKGKEQSEVEAKAAKES